MSDALIMTSAGSFTRSNGMRCVSETFKYRAGLFSAADEFTQSRPREEENTLYMNDTCTCKCTIPICAHVAIHVNEL